MKRIFILSAVLLTACSTGEIKFSEAKVNYDSSKSEVKITYPVAECGNSEIAQKVNKEITTCFLSSETPSFDAIVGQAKQFEKDTIGYSNVGEWYGFRNSQIISITINKNTYMGGAHGGANIYTLCFDAKSGAKLNIVDHIADTAKFRQLLISQYITQNSLDINTPAEQIGYFTELRNLPIPAALELNEQGMLISYGQYEIAAYAVGITQALIPYDKLDGLLKLDISNLKPIVLQEK